MELPPAEPGQPVAPRKPTGKVDLFAGLWQPRLVINQALIPLGMHSSQAEAEAAYDAGKMLLALERSKPPLHALKLHRPAALYQAHPLWQRLVPPLCSFDAACVLLAHGLAAGLLAPAEEAEQRLRVVQEAVVAAQPAAAQPAAAQPAAQAPHPDQQLQPAQQQQPQARQQAAEQQQHMSAPPTQSAAVQRLTASPTTAELADGEGVGDGAVAARAGGRQAGRRWRQWPPSSGQYCVELSACVIKRGRLTLPGWMREAGCPELGGQTSGRITLEQAGAGPQPGVAGCSWECNLRSYADKGGTSVYAHAPAALLRAHRAQPGDLLTLCGLPGRRRAAFAIWPASSPTARQFAAFAAGAAPGSSGRRRSAAAESAEGEGSDAEEEWDSSQRDDASEEDGSVEESEEESGVESEPDSAGEAEGGGQPELAGQICQWLEVPAGSGQFCIRLTERVQAGVKLDLPAWILKAFPAIERSSGGSLELQPMGSDDAFTLRLYSARANDRQRPRKRTFLSSQLVSAHKLKVDDVLVLHRSATMRIAFEVWLAGSAEALQLEQHGNVPAAAAAQAAPCCPTVQRPPAAVVAPGAAPLPRGTGSGGGGATPAGAHVQAGAAAAPAPQKGVSYVSRWLESPAGSGQYCIRLTEAAAEGAILNLPAWLVARFPAVQLSDAGRLQLAPAGGCGSCALDWKTYFSDREGRRRCQKAVYLHSDLRTALQLKAGDVLVLHGSASACVACEVWRAGSAEARRFERSGHLPPAAHPATRSNGGSGSELVGSKREGAPHAAPPADGKRRVAAAEEAAEDEAEDEEEGGAKEMEGEAAGGGGGTADAAAAVWEASMLGTPLPPVSPLAADEGTLWMALAVVLGRAEEQGGLPDEVTAGYRPAFLALPAAWRGVHLSLLQSFAVEGQWEEAAAWMRLAAGQQAQHAQQQSLPSTPAQ